MIWNKILIVATSFILMQSNMYGVERSNSQELLFKIQDTLKNQFSAYNVNIIVKDGNVTLEGSVESEEEKKHIEELVKGVEGVKHIKNELKIEKN